MARVEWVKAKLDNWARWVTQRADGSSGYPKTSPMFRGAGEVTSSDTSKIPVNDIDASRTHEAIEQMRFVHSGLWLVLQCHYVGDPQTKASRRRPMSTEEIAQRMSIGRRMVQTRLEAADMALSANLRSAAVDS